MTIMNKTQKNQSGIIRLALAIIVIVIILTILKIDLRSFFNSELWQSNWGVAKDLALKIYHWLLEIWVKYGSEPTKYLWETILKPLIAKIIA